MEKVSKFVNLPAVLHKAYDLKIHLVFSFVVLCSIASHITIPAVPVPFTLQTLAVLITGAFLGSRYGFYTIMLYVLLGAAGLPVFAPVADGTFGFFSMFGPTGGYILAFPFGAFLAGLIIERNRSFFSVLSAFIIGEFIIIASGVLYLNTFFLHDITASILVGASLFTIWTAAKVLFGTGITMIFKRLRK